VNWGPRSGPHAGARYLDQGVGSRLAGLLREYFLWLRRHFDSSKRLIQSEIGGFPAALDLAPNGRRAHHPWHRKDSSEAFNSIDDLVAGVAHEIRNPLAAIRLWMSLIQDTVENDDEFSRRCCLVTQEITRLERLSQSLVECARMPEPRFHPQLVRSVVSRTLEMLAPKLENMQIRVRRRDSLQAALARVDEEQLEQVLINILGNAIEAMGGPGEIRISTDIEPQGSRQAVVVRVQDSGPGMPARIRERAAEPFVTTKHRGRGLGLYLANRIMKMHGGTLSFASPSEGGTVVELRIPAVRSNGRG
jgi:signal transduction histidine kinase